MKVFAADDRLKDVIRLSKVMIGLADAGDACREDIGCGIIFGTLRDQGYRLHQLAHKELTDHQTLYLNGFDISTQRENIPNNSAQGVAMNESAKILVVDDEVDIALFLKTLLEDNGYQVVYVHNGVDALVEARTQHFDLITLDITMPEKSGVRAYRELKDDLKLRSIPVVIITGIGDEMKRFLEGRRQVPNPEGFITKPIDQKLLLSTIKTLLEK
jgi:CheY-like chemotaxis protein